METKTLRKILISIFIFLSVVIFGRISLAAPLIDSVRGVIINGEIITVAGSDFGNTGPNVFLFDDFSRGSSGDLIAAAANIGTWYGMKSVFYADPLLSNNQGARCFGGPTVTTPNGGWYNNNTILFDSVYSEIFVSSRAYVPDGYYFPPAKTEETLPSISSLKHHWLYYTPTGYAADNNPDLFSPNWAGVGDFFKITSNDYARSAFDRTGNVQWVWDDPVRWSLWVKGNGLSILGSDGFFQAASSSGQTYQRYKDYKSWFAESDNVYGFDRITIPGFLTGQSDVNANYIVDDIYVAVGHGAAARVEIGNHSNYTDCTKLAIGTPIDWYDTNIVLTFREGTFKYGEQAYLFVIDSDNNISEGYPITIGETETPIETCSDNIQNQDETGIDCGGVCEACVVPTTYGLSNFISAITNWLGIGDSNSDVNSDGVVNTRDLGVMMSSWGN